MKIRLLIVLVAAVGLISCKKNTGTTDEPSYIKALESDFEAITVGSVLLSDNSTILVCRSLDETEPGCMYKLDPAGNLVWKKSLNPGNVGCYQVYDLKGNGFAVLGYTSVNDQYFQIFRYDDEGNFISTKSINFNMLWYSVRYFTVIQMYELSNGNFVFAYNEGDLILNITNNSFDSLYSSKIKVGRFTGAFVRGIYQNTDSTILFANAMSEFDPFKGSEMDFDLQMVQTDLKGNLKSSIIIGDSSTNETPHALLPLGNRMLLVSGRMGALNVDNGVVVNYFNNNITRPISATINLVELSRDGKFESRSSIHDYPANGMIMNARKTADGGSILCGTVGQSNVMNITSPTKIYLMKLDAKGRFEWSKTIATTYPSYGVDVHQRSDGGYVVSGYQKTMEKRFSPVVILTDPSGNF